MITCSKCHRPTYSGCGAHIEQVLGHVPVPDRCTCRALASAGKPEGFAQRLRGLFGK